jgi:hypothetical protein
MIRTSRSDRPQDDLPRHALRDGVKEQMVGLSGIAVPAQELIEVLAERDGKRPSTNTVRSNLRRINDMLAETDYQVGWDRMRPARSFLTIGARRAA